MADLSGAVEISEDRRATSIVLAGYLGDRLRVDLVDYPGEPGAAAVTEVERLTDRYGVTAWAVDPASPAGSMLLPLAAVGVDTVELSAREVAAACGRFLDLVRDGTGIRAGRSRRLRESVRAAEARRVAGGVAWDRSAGDAGPMLAASLAVDVCVNYSGLGPDDVHIGWSGDRAGAHALLPHLAGQAGRIEQGFGYPTAPNWPGMR